MLVHSNSRQATAWEQKECVLQARCRKFQPRCRSEKDAGPHANAGTLPTLPPATMTSPILIGHSKSRISSDYSPSAAGGQQSPSAKCQNSEGSRREKVAPSTWPRNMGLVNTGRDKTTRRSFLFQLSEGHTTPQSALAPNSEFEQKREIRGNGLRFSVRQWIPLRTN
jgi:hypothetical protein